MSTLANSSLDVVEVNLKGRQNGLAELRDVTLLRSLCLRGMSQASLLLSSHRLLASFGDKSKFLLLLVEDKMKGFKVISQLDGGVLHLVNNLD